MRSNVNLTPWSRRDNVSYVDVVVYDANNQPRSLTDLLGWDWVKNLSLSTDLDTFVTSGSIVLSRNTYDLNLSPFVLVSNNGLKVNAVNEAYGNIGNEEGFVDIWHRIKIYQCVIGTDDRRPAYGDAAWQEVFDGYIVDVIVGSDVRIEIADKAIELQRGLVVGFTDADNLHYHKTYSPDGTVPLVLVMQQILDDAYTQGVTPTAWKLYTPNGTLSTPIIAEDGPAVIKSTPYEMKTQMVSQALQDLADLVGFELHFKWHDNTGAFQLILEEPKRLTATSQWSFTPSMCRDLTIASKSIRDIRNHVVCKYPSRAEGWDTNNDGVIDADEMPWREVELWDNDSRARYGYATMWVSESSTSQIDSLEEATEMATAMMSDLSQPQYAFEVTLNFFWWPGALNDFYTFTGDGVVFSGQYEGAVARIKHEFAMQGGTTTLTMRVRPASRLRAWLRREARPGQAKGTPSRTLARPSLTVQGVAGGYQLETPVATRDLKKLDRFEIHRSPISDFVPTATTLVGTTRSSSVFIPEEIVTQQTNFKVIAVDRWGNRSEPSFEIQAQPRAIPPATISDSAFSARGLYPQGLFSETLD